MSDLNDLIHTNAQRAYEQGVMRERERIIKMLIDKAIQWRGEKLNQQADYIDFAIDLIKGEQK